LLVGRRWPALAGIVIIPVPLATVDPATSSMEL
jgi:hypothetical protein